MTRVSKIARAVGYVLWTSALTTAATSSIVFAQDKEAAEPQTVVVTGSRISRPELEGTTPVLTLNSDALKAQGLSNIADIATALPQFAPAFGSSRTQSTFSGAELSGLNQVNLRNLTPERSVVLINGRRVPGGTSTSTAVDFSTLPTANIDHIEISTGGAAAVYGADAVAGVVNIITKQNFNGVEIGASYGSAEKGDNANPNGYIMLGGPLGETGHGLLTIQYDKQGRVSCADRFLCAQDFAWTSPTRPPVRGPAAQSGVPLNGRFFTPDGASYTRRGDSLTDTNGDLIPFSVAIDGFNRNATRDLAIPTERIMVAAEGKMEIGHGISAFSEINFGQSETNSQFEGHPFQSGAAGSNFGGNDRVPGLSATIPLNNPFVPTALRDAWLAANADADEPVDPATGEIDWFQRLNFGGFRGANNNRQTVRAVAGLRGDFDSIFGLGSNWSWEFHHVYGRTSLDGLTDGLVGTDRLYNALRVEPDPDNAGGYRCTDAGARATGCIPINPFQPYTKAMVDYLSLRAGQHGRSTLQDTQAYISGSIFEMPAGPLQTAIGVERRRFEGYLDYDVPINLGLATGNQIGDVDPASISAKEVYIEGLIPIFKDMPFMEALSLEGAYRHSDTNVGNYNTWKYGGEWAPLKSLRFRVMRSRSVRAPVPGDLSGIGQTFGVVNDPCVDEARNDNPTRAANCASDGVPAGYEPLLITTQSVAGFTGGNPALTPEKGDSLTFGFVLAPEALDGFTLTVDRFKIAVTDIITTVARQTAVNLCYDTPDRLFCDQVTRGSSPAEGAKTYVLKSVNEQLQNVASQDISGYDIQARYGFDLSSPFRSDRNLGKLDVQLLLTIYDRADLLPLPGEDTIDLLGAAGGSTDDQGYLKKSGVLNLTYTKGPIGVNWHTRYIGKATMAPPGFLAEGFPDIPAHFYHDLRVSYNFGEGSELYAGVNNVFDKDPPFFASGSSGTQALDTIPGYYDVFGRSYYGGVRVKF
ncbi:MAG: TonB-dependent receptor [Gammaproteobacteria bacterium]